MFGIIIAIMAIIGTICTALFVIHFLVLTLYGIWAECENLPMPLDERTKFGKVNMFLLMLFAFGAIICITISLIMALFIKN